MRPNVWTFTDAAEYFGTDPRVIAGLAKSLKIRPKRTGLAGKSKGLDVKDMARLGKSLERPFALADSAKAALAS